MAEAEILEGVASVAREEWDALVGNDSPFLEWDWLASLEDAGAVGEHTGWLPRPLVVREEGRIVAACPLYLKNHSEGEFVFDWAWADAAERAGIRYYPKLLVGVPFTPVTGARFLVAKELNRHDWIQRMGHLLTSLCESDEFSGVHVNFCHEEEALALSDSTRETSGRYLLRLGLQYHWKNRNYDDFEAYLGDFRSKRRNQIRRERRALDEQEITIDILTGEAIPDDLFEPMYRCYLATIEDRSWGRQYLNLQFFEFIRERFRHRLCFVVARREGKVIAGTTNLFKGKSLYGRYWGALEPARHLHFNVCYYAAIEFCIEHGLERFEPGAGGDYKYLRGFDAQPTFSIHYLRDPRLSDAVSRFLDSERDNARSVIRQLKEQSALKPKTTD
ncbi:GNAT family N-acetyltransferase [Myxococcota bacterium]|nr:GNAT family N-acetyltransferase [Myxococcota bacterium]